MIDKHTLEERLTLDRYPRSANYDPEWQVAHVMGPNALWLAESLTRAMNLQPGMRVLDLGCGMAMSSIFLAKEFDLQIWATDLWIPATENLARIREADVEDRVFPIHAEAHTLPYADGFFDAIVSIDAYHYVGTDDLYAPTMAKLLKPGGQFGIVVPGLTHELDDVPEPLQPWWDPAYWSFHSAAWWARHFERSGAFTVNHAQDIPGAVDDWILWDRACRDYGLPDHLPTDPHTDQMLAADAGRTIALVEVVAHAIPERS